MRRSQVGLDDLRVLLHLGRRAFGDLLAVVEHQHAVADVHHQPHVVLDQQQRDAVVADAPDQLAERNALRGVHARGRLVQGEELGLGGEGPRDLEPALVAVRQAAGGLVRACADADVVEQLQRAFLDGLFLCQGALGAQHRADHPGAAAQVPADHHVLKRRQVGEQADVLEGARDSGLRHVVRLQPAQAAPAEGERAGVGGVDPGQHVEERGLARAVRSDQAVDLALTDREGDVLQRLHAAEALGDTPGRKELAHARCCSSSSRFRTAEGSRPAGRKSITRTSARPNSSMRITSGSTSMRPKSASCTGVTVQRRISGTKESSSAPRITPQTLPMPPSTTIDTTMIDSTRMKLSGEMKAWIAENMPPAMPPKLAPMANASSFRLRVSMPMARAAISSSRIASQARPMREFCRRRLTTMTASATRSNR